MAPLLKELSSIEVEPLQIVEHEPASEQESRLDDLIAMSGNFEVEALLTGTMPSNDSNPCCCCCCVPCCCAPC
jgi:hypothetical protein